MADLVHVQLARIVKNDLTDKQLIYLKEVDGDRQFPIVIGFFEATNIDLVLRLIRNGETIDVDARPSDAIAVAVSFRPILPIWVSQEVFDRFAQ